MANQLATVRRRRPQPPGPMASHIGDYDPHDVVVSSLSQSVSVSALFVLSFVVSFVIVLFSAFSVFLTPVVLYNVLRIVCPLIVCAIINL